MVKVYIPKFLDGVPYIPLLIPNLGPVKFGGELFKENTFRDFKDSAVEIVPDISEADFMLMPHNFSLVIKNNEYLKIFLDLFEKYKKKMIIFAYGDRDLNIDLPGAIVFKYSMYKSSKHPNEIKMPTYVEDLGNEKIEFRSKTSPVPVVGFCGWADYQDRFSHIKTVIKNIIIDVQSLSYGKKWGMRKKGVYFRKKILEALIGSRLIIPNFIIRKTFSSHQKTIDLSPEIARRQYVENIFNSDFSLAIRGDGNESMRFYEILSLGRIPILIDTDIVLPLEDKINYDDFILRIYPEDFSAIDVLTADFYRKTSAAVLIEMQKKARAAFEGYLRPDSYFRHMFSDPKIILSQINR